MSGGKERDPLALGQMASRKLALVKEKYIDGLVSLLCAGVEDNNLRKKIEVILGDVQAALSWYASELASLIQESERKRFEKMQQMLQPKGQDLGSESEKRGAALKFTEDDLGGASS